MEPLEPLLSEFCELQTPDGKFKFRCAGLDVWSPSVSFWGVESAGGPTVRVSSHFFKMCCLCSCAFSHIAHGHVCICVWWPEVCLFKSPFLGLKHPSHSDEHSALRLWRTRARWLTHASPALRRLRRGNGELDGHLDCTERLSVKTRVFFYSV